MAPRSPIVIVGNIPRPPAAVMAASVAAESVVARYTVQKAGTGSAPGIGGDMPLGALLDAGLLVADLQRPLNGLKVPGWRLDVARVTKQGIAGTQVKVLVDETADLPHRHLADILALLAASDLDEVVRERATAVFRRLAAAEAAVHGSDIAHVHFHEVGALDSIVDIVGAVAGLHLLGVERIAVSYTHLTLPTSDLV